MNHCKNSIKRTAGNTGECIALQYLQSKGYAIIETNYAVYGGEIDIVASDSNRLDQTVFVEVRYRRGESHGHPLDTITKKKQKALLRTAETYARKNGITIEKCRFDCIALMPISQGGHRVWHVKNMMDFLSYS